MEEPLVIYTSERVDRHNYWIVLIREKDIPDPIGTIRIDKSDEQVNSKLKMWETLPLWLNSQGGNTKS